MSGIDSDILREKIKERMPKPPHFSLGVTAFIATAIILLLLLVLVKKRFL